MEDEKASGPSSVVSPLILPPSLEIDLEAFVGDQLQCQICVETDGRDFIAPCRCEGTSKYVHHDYLDHWSAVKTPLDARVTAAFTVVVGAVQQD